MEAARETGAPVILQASAGARSTRASHSSSGIEPTFGTPYEFTALIRALVGGEPCADPRPSRRRRSLASTGHAK